MEKMIAFKSYDGTELAGRFTIPTREPVACALMVHGIPSDMDEWGFYRDMATAFAAANIASFRFDFRGCGASAPRALAALTVSEMINDIDSAYWQVIGEFSGRVSLFAVSTSCGGGVTLRWANTFSRRLDHLFLMAPVLDYEYEVTGQRGLARNRPAWLTTEDAQRLAETGTIGGTGYGGAMANDARAFDGRSELERFAGRLTIFQGDSDAVVPLEITQEMVTGLANIELRTLEGADHGFAVPGDEDLTAPGTKRNHLRVYDEVIRRISGDHKAR